MDIYEYILMGFAVIFSMGFFTGMLMLFIFFKVRLGRWNKLGKEIIERADKEASKSLQETESKVKQMELDKVQKVDKVCEERRTKLLKQEDQLKEKEEEVEKKILGLDKREEEYNKKMEVLKEKTKDIKKKEADLFKELEAVSQITEEEGRKTFLEKVAKRYEKEGEEKGKRIKKDMEESAEMEAGKILVTALSRLAVKCTSEITTRTVSLSSEEMKARIIGREGRNIRAFERAAGVNLIIDDTPSTVLLSGFDQLRLSVAQMALQDLVSDGRIHIGRIEEKIEETKEKVKKQMYHHGEIAALKCNCLHLHEELIKILGKLHFHYSLGQNVLDHSVEVSLIMGLIAEELKLDKGLAQRIGLLHDIGKAFSQEEEGSHAKIGYEKAKLYGESEKVANGIGCHHKEMEAISVEGSLCDIADAISASRVGARMEVIDKYIRRLTKMEQMAYEYPGVQKAYALQAGKELRVSVLPDSIDDEGAYALAKKLTERIEKELEYSGKIKVTVLRERQATSYAI